jgi:hypothetical protein
VPHGWIGDLGDGTSLFSAWVDFDENGPFDFVNGPDRVPVEEALAWARRYAERITVRVGDEHFTAGEVAVEGRPTWDDRIAAFPPEPAAHESGGPQWYVEASTGWYREDREAVLTRLSRALRADARATEEAQELSDNQITVTFAVQADTRLAAQEEASRIMRDAWAASDTEAIPGHDFDLPGMLVTPDPPSSEL